MPYVGRDATGRVVVVAEYARPDAEEFLAADSEELRASLAQFSPLAGSDLARSDQDLIRVVEDIVDTLIEKNLIRFTDLPLAAQQKLTHRRSLRLNRSPLDLLGGGPAEDAPVIKL